MENLIINVLALAALAGAITQQVKSLEKKIDKLEKKQDKHNNLVSRLAVVENVASDAHNRLDKHEEHTLRYVSKSD